MSSCHWFISLGKMTPKFFHLVAYCRISFSLVSIVCIYNSLHFFLKSEKKINFKRLGTSLKVQWLRLCTSSVEGMGSIPGRGTKILQATQHKKKSLLHRNVGKLQVHGVELFKIEKWSLSPLSGWLLLSPGCILVCGQNYHDTTQMIAAFRNKKQIAVGSISCSSFV